jgi:diguanylate cyclase (GGDEF)-like protein
MTSTYSSWLVALSIGVAILVAYTSLGLASRVAESRYASRRTWLILGAISMGTGIWAMHFIGMLAFSLSIQLRYDVLLTLLSLGTAILTSGFAIAIASRSRLELPRHVAGSLVMGMGIVAMHYIGMSAIQISPAISYDLVLVAGSVLIAVVASFVALWLTFNLRGKNHRHVWAARLGASVVMGVAIAGMHYTGMAAARFAMGSYCRGGFALDDHWFAIAIAIGSVALLSITVIAMIYDAHLESHMRLHALGLQQANERLKHEVTHDALTNLPNRALFIDQLTRAIQNVGSGQPLVAVISVNLDRFRRVNESLGHSHGNTVLQEVAARLRAATGEQGTVGRLGADDFLVLIPAAQVQHVALLAGQIVQSLSQPYSVGSITVHLAASVGITTYPFDNSQPSVLISHADEILFEVKSRGGNGFGFFLPGTTLYTPQRLQLENDLREAAQLGQLELHYQPKVNILSGEIVGLEALARWRHPQRGWIAPGEFIPLAEASDLIIVMGRWILNEACRQAQVWQNAGYVGFSVAVNISGRQFRRPDLLLTIRQAVAQYNLQPHDIEVELTESVVMSDADRSIETLKQLRDLGVHIAVDDFGTGYSSISYLKRLPVSALKIDRSFIVDLGTSIKSNQIVKAVISLAHGLDMIVVAEGVETETQLSILRSCGCDQYQGYLFSKPRSAEEITELLGHAPRSAPVSAAHELMMMLSG